MRATLRKRIERLAGRLNAGTKRTVLVFLLADATQDEADGLVSEYEQTLDGRYGFLQIDDAFLVVYGARRGPVGKSEYPPSPSEERAPSPPAKRGLASLLAPFTLQLINFTD